MVLSDGLVAYWSAENDYVDATGNGNNGTPTSITFTTGKIGNAFLFNANGDNISTPLVLTPNNDLSYSAWVYTDGTTGEFRTIMSDSNAGFTVGHTFNWEPTNSHLVCYSRGSTNFSTASSSNSITTNTWHYAVFTYNAATNDAKIYIDGSADGTSSGTPSSSAGGTFKLGQMGDFNDREWRGRLDEMGVWNRVLSPSEITELWNSGSGLSYADIIAAAGYSNKVNGVTPAKINGIAVADISKFNGV